MSFISIFCFIVFGVLIYSFFIRTTDIFAPVRLFLVIWTLSIGLAELKLSRYQVAWSTYGWFALILPLFSTLVGMFIIYVLNFNESVKPLPEIRSSLKIQQINTKFLFQIIITLFLIYAVSYLVSAAIVGYITFFAPKPDRARMSWGIFGFGLFVQSIPALLYLIIQYLVVTRKQFLNKAVALLIFLISITSYFFLLERYYLVFSLFIITITLYYRSNLFRLRNVMAVFLGLGFLFYGISSIRMSRYAINFLYYLSDMKYSVKYALFTEPYMYIVMNLENFAYAVTKVEKFTYGLLTFDPIFAITGLKHNIIEYLSLPKYPAIVNSNFNTFTMFFIYYWDFGILGLTVIPFLLGLLFSSVYYQMRRKPSLVSVSIYSIVVFIITFSFFVPILSFLHFVVNFLIIYIVSKKVTETSTVCL